MRILPSKFKFNIFDSILNGARAELYTKNLHEFRDTYDNMSGDESGWNLSIGIEDSIVNSLGNKL